MKISLNLSKPGNYAFFCPQSGVHLTLGNPIANVSGVTPAIDRGLKTKVIVKLDDTPVENKTETKAAPPVKETPKEEPKTEVKEEPVKEEPKEEAPKKRGGRPSKKSN